MKQILIASFGLCLLVVQGKLTFGESQKSIPLKSEDRLHHALSKDRTKHLRGDMQRAAHLVAGGTEIVPALIEQIDHVDIRYRRPAFIALGFLSRPRDQAALSVLERYAFNSNEPFHEEAMEALLRIGDDCVTRVFEKFEHMPYDSKIVSHAYHTIWSIPSLEDLRSVLRITRDVVETSTNEKLQIALKYNYLPVIEDVVRMREDAEPETGCINLGKYLNERGTLVTIPGPDITFWIVNRLVQYRVTSAIPQMREFLKIREPYNLNPSIKYHILKNLEKLGDSLTPDEQAFLRGDHLPEELRKEWQKKANEEGPILLDYPVEKFLEKDPPYWYKESPSMKSSR